MRTEPKITMLQIDQAKSELSRFADKEYRENQAETISFIMNSKKRYRVVKARTGFGKSLAAVACGVLAGSLNYLVQSKFLQTQIIGDFPEMVSIWGRGNYKCLYDDSRMCNECTHTKARPCEDKDDCLYDVQKEMAVHAPYRTLNFAYYMVECQHIGKFSGSSFTVVDEADSLEGTLLENVILEFTERALYQLGLAEGPSKKTVKSSDGIEIWTEFGELAQYKAGLFVKKLEESIDAIPNSGDKDEKIRLIREKDYFKNIHSKCGIFLSSIDKTWLMEETPRHGSVQGKISFRPTWITPELSEEYLWRHSHDWVLISATLPPLPVFCKQLGIDEDEIDYLEVPSTFDPERSPVHIWPVANLTAKMMDIEVPKAIHGIKQILTRHRGERGMIHTVSWKLCSDIMRGVRSSRLITHTSENRNSVINEFMDIDGFDKDSVLVSPSCQRGVDLRDDLCRFVIIVKTPFLSLGSKYVGARLYGSGAIGKLWYQAEAMTQIEQMAGRGWRSKTDWCTVYIIDEQADKLYKKRPSLFSDAFQEQISWDDNELENEPLQMELEGFGL